MNRAGGEALLEVEDLTLDFPAGRHGWVNVVNSVSFEVGAGEIVGMVGESGSGKTVTSLALVGLTNRQGGVIRSGSVRLAGVDLLTKSEKELRAVRGDRVGMIFQQPIRSLNPSFTVGEQIAEIVRRHRGSARRAAWARAVELLDRVHIADAERRAHDYPHMFSGGMAQRVMIAMSLACEPELLIADEPTTALDVTVQAVILDLLREIQQETGVAILLISHDLAVVAETCDRVVVLYAGQVAEQGSVEEVFTSPQHPYTEGLLSCIPRVGSGRLVDIPGTVPRPGELVAGCRFHPRCPHAEPGRCDVQAPELVTVDDHQARCLRVDELDLVGVDAR